MTRYSLREKQAWPEGMQVCFECDQMLPYEMFGRDKTKWNGLSNRCKPCRKVYSKYHYDKWFKNNAEARLFSAARSRAARDGIPFTISVSDVIIPDTCPVLGIPLYREGGKNMHNTPSLDRFIPELGYVPGNVHVISWRANWLKNNATVEELEALVEWMRDTCSI